MPKKNNLNCMSMGDIHAAILASDNETQAAQRLGVRSRTLGRHLGNGRNLMISMSLG